MSERYLHVRCECHHPLHFIDFDFWPDDKWGDEITASFVGGQNPSFLTRLSVAVKYVFGRERLVEADIILTKEKALELAAFLHRSATNGARTE
ncbi:hypothetical protein BFS86_19545 [Shewanella algae]|nr:hypothetical protein BFS86_19545 [Shewanella algae]